MVVVKAYIKRDKREDLAPVEACLSNMAKALDTRSCPNVLPYQRWLQSDVSVRFGAGTMLNVNPSTAFYGSTGGRWPLREQEACIDEDALSLRPTIGI